MGKKKSDIYVCFQILPYKNKANKSIFQCKFCDRQYLQNATKMESHIITQCQKVPAAIRASYTTKPGNNGGGVGGSGSAALTGLNLSLMNKHDDLDINDLIREYSDSSASEAPEQMVVNVNVPGMFRMGKSSSSSAAGSSGSSGRGSSNNHSPSGLAITQNQDINQRSMQIRAFSQLVTGASNSYNNGNGNSNGGGSGRKRPKLDNHNNNNNTINNNNYYTLGGAGNPNKILIKPSHGVPASSVMPTLGGPGGAGRNNSNSNKNNLSSTSATLTAVSGGATGGIRKLKPPLHLAGATITKNANVYNNNIGRFKEKLSREETVDIWRLLARAIYSSDVPLSILENEHWINAMNRIQPSLTLPSTNVLSNALLDQEYSRIAQDIEERVEKSHFSVLECVTVPGNRIDEVTLVFYLNCDDYPNPYLYKTHRISADSDSDGYTKDNLSKIIEDTILDIGLNKVVAFMSDLTPEMEATWEILRDRFPGLLTFGCVIHGLNSILDKILTLPEIIKMVDISKKLYNKIEKSHELKKLIEDTTGTKHISPYDSEEDANVTGSLLNNNIGCNKYSSINNNNNHCNNLNNNGNVSLLTKWKLVGKLVSQLISEKAVYISLLGKPDAKKVIDGASSDSPGGKSDRSLTNHLSSESFWFSLESLNSIIVPCIQWIDSLKPDRDCSLSEVPEIFKELKALLQSHVRNFPVDDTTKQSVQKYFLQVQRKCVNEIHFTASLLNPSHKLKGVLTEDEEAQGMEFLTYFCDSRGYHAGSILRELADYKRMNGLFATEKIWKMGQTLDAPAWWKAVQGDSALFNIAISLAKIVPSCSIPGHKLLNPDYGDLLDAEKGEKLAYIQYNLHKPKKAKLPKTNVVVQQQQQQQQQKVQQPEKPKEKEPPPVPAKIEKLRIKIPKKEDTESPAMDLSARLSGCSQVSDEEEDEDDEDSGNEGPRTVATSKICNDNKIRIKQLSSPPPKPDDDQSSDDGSTKDDSSSDSDDSSSDDQSD